jgi:light-regulated signal transduction histidine kinase (bacteriophytochrome)
MSDLIDDLLEFSRSGRTELYLERVELDPLVHEVIQGLEMGTRGRAIDWHIEKLPPVRGDTALLRQVFANLIGNALKYTQPRDPARIEVGCAGEEEGRQVFYVKDNGVGFDMKHAGKLFGLFQRLHRADEFEGTGIGLANVRRIVARHGGTVWAEAEPGRGATFYFSLEAAPP